MAKKTKRDVELEQYQMQIRRLDEAVLAAEAINRAYTGRIAELEQERNRARDQRDRLLRAMQKCSRPVMFEAIQILVGEDDA